MSGAMANTVDTHESVIDAHIRDVLRSASANGAKWMARKWGVSHRTIQGWRQGRGLPIDAETIALLAACDELWAEVETLRKERKALLSK